MSDFLKLTDSLSLWFSTLRPYIDAELQKACANLKQDVPARLLESMSYSLLAPGKRLRPLLVFIATPTVKGENLTLELLQEATPAALAVEMIHAYSLIHDDLPAMDDDDFRRGRPTNHKQFDEATAILAGDALQTFAFEILGKLGEISSRRAVRAFRILSRAAGSPGMVGGQMDDIQFTPNALRPVLPLTLYGCFPSISEALESEELRRFGASSWKPELRALESMQDRKTGALITASVMLGGVVGGATEEQLFRLGLYGQYLGLMFQITDDLLDATSTAEQMGKKVGKDDEKGKVTWVNHLGIDDSRRYVGRLAALAKGEVTGKAFADPSLLVQLVDFVEQRTH